MDHHAQMGRTNTQRTLVPRLWVSGEDQSSVCVETIPSVPDKVEDLAGIGMPGTSCPPPREWPPPNETPGQRPIGHTDFMGAYDAAAGGTYHLVRQGGLRQGVLPRLGDEHGTETGTEGGTSGFLRGHRPSVGCARLSLVCP